MKSSVKESGSVAIGTAVRTAIGGVLLIALIYLAGGAGVVRAVTAADFSWLGLAVVGVFIDRLLMAYRWWLLAAHARMIVPYWQLVRIYLVTGFLGSFVPSSVGTDLLSVLALARRTGRNLEAASIVVVDRVMGLLVLGVVGGIAALAAISYDIVAVPREWLLATALVFGLGGVAIALSFHGAAERAVAKYSTWLPGERIGPLVRQWFGGYRAYGESPQTLIKVSLVTVGNRLVSTGVVYFVSLSMNLEVSFLFYLIAMSLVTVVIMIPVSVGGLGVQEGALAGMLSLVGVPLEAGVALAVLNRVAWSTMSIPGAILYATGGIFARAKEAERA